MTDRQPQRAPSPTCMFWLHHNPFSRTYRADVFVPADTGVEHYVGTLLLHRDPAKRVTIEGQIRARSTGALVRDHHYAQTSFNAEIGVLQFVATEGVEPTLRAQVQLSSGAYALVARLPKITERIEGAVTCLATPASTRKNV